MTAEPGVVARAALALTDWAERWVPDAFVFALLATFLVLGAAATTTGSTIAAIVDAWGRGFWELIPFTLQMSLIIITGHVLATSPPMGRVIRAIAGWPRSPRGAGALVTAFTRTARDLGIDLGESASRGESRIPNPESRSLPPGQRLEHSRVLTWLVVALGGAYLARYFWQAGDPLSALTLNVLNLAFLMMGFLLHGTPARLMRAVQAATPAVWGVILQFPFYAGIAGVITGTNLGRQLADLFVRVSTRTTFPPLVALYSAVLGVFVPSGGSKWVIEAPYVMQAAHTHHVHLGWIVSAYDLGEALANLLQPFWMLPVLGLFKLAARDVMGYTMVVCLALTPVVLILVTLLGLTLSYPL